jgi:superfamily II DNA/RNA helicase
MPSLRPCLPVLTCKPNLESVTDFSVIATPGRFLHLGVEMDLDLRQVQVVVYDEADR